LLFWCYIFPLFHLNDSHSHLSTLQNSFHLLLIPPKPSQPALPLPFHYQSSRPLRNLLSCPAQPTLSRTNRTSQPKPESTEAVTIFLISTTRDELSIKGNVRKKCHLGDRLAMYVSRFVVVSMTRFSIEIGMKDVIFIAEGLV